MISHAQMVARIAAGAALGGVIGYERDRHGRPVGLRTHFLVAMASATFMVVSSQFVYLQNYGEHDLAEVDGARIAASVVSGIGFLAGGAILRTGASVQGLTTAAALWLVSAIGLCCGGGMFIEGVFVTILGVFALTTLRRFEDKDDAVVKRRISLVLTDDANALSKVTDMLHALQIVVSHIDYERRRDDKQRIAVVLDARVPAALSASQLIERLESLPEVRRIHIQTG